MEAQAIDVDPYASGDDKPSGSESKGGQGRTRVGLHLF